MATWNETAKRFLQVTDRLGKPIDEGIFETVVALNMLGIETTQSCEGHLDWGVPYPWFHIRAELEQKFLLHTYLVQFYTQHSPPFDRVLAFHGYRVSSQGGIFAPFFSKEEQQQRLTAYQAEMQAFTHFLKSLSGL